MCVCYLTVDCSYKRIISKNVKLFTLKHYMNSINKNIQFTLETEVDNQLIFKDLSVIKHIDKLKFNIYRKPTITDVTIHADSHHPFSQKLAAYNYFIRRLLAVPLSDYDYREELNTINHIALACLLYTSRCV